MAYVGINRKLIDKGFVPEYNTNVSRFLNYIIEQLPLSKKSSAIFTFFQEPQSPTNALHF